MTSAATPPGAGEASAAGTVDLDLGWRLHPGVSVRPEPFGALLYHFHTRRLSFLKHPTIVEVVETLADHHTAREACSAAGVDIDDPKVARLYMHALGQLADSRMIEPRTATAEE